MVEELSQEQWVSRRERYRQGAEHGVSNSQGATTTVLAGVGEEEHCREGTHDLTQVQGPLWR